MNEFVKVPNNTPPYEKFVEDLLKKWADHTSTKTPDGALLEILNPNSDRYKAMKTNWVAAMSDETWRNDTYQVTIDWNSTEHDCLSPDDDLKVVHLSIKRLDNDIMGDYREFMAIKDRFVGEDHEAVMLFPSRSREHDTCNQFHLWCPMTKDDTPVVVPFGWDNGRHVTDSHWQGGNQRPFQEET
jgi:hypothetical protein